MISQVRFSYNLVVIKCYSSKFLYLADSAHKMEEQSLSCFLSLRLQQESPFRLTSFES